MIDPNHSLWRPLVLVSYSCWGVTSRYVLKITMHLQHTILLALLTLVAFAGCNSRTVEDIVDEPSDKWDITYFSLADDFQTTANESTKANSIVVGRIDTSEIFLRSMGSDGTPLPCDILREGQLVEEGTGRSFPVRVDFRAGLFSELEDANGLTVKIHVTDKLIDDSFRISHRNVTAIERSR